MALFATRDILPHTDLSIDYGDEWWVGETGERARGFSCACGWIFCRHRQVGTFFWGPSAVMLG